MNDAMKTFNNWAIQIIVAASLYGGFYLNIDGCQNIIGFLYWLTFCISLPTLFVDDIKQAMMESMRGRKERRFNPPRWAGVMLDCLVAGVLVYSGWIITAVAVVVTMAVVQTIRDEAFKTEATS